MSTISGDNQLLDFLLYDDGLGLDGLWSADSLISDVPAIHQDDQLASLPSESLPTSEKVNELLDSLLHDVDLDLGCASLEDLWSAESLFGDVLPIKAEEDPDDQLATLPSENLPSSEDPNEPPALESDLKKEENPQCSDSYVDPEASGSKSDDLEIMSESQVQGLLSGSSVVSEVAFEITVPINAQEYPAHVQVLNPDDIENVGVLLNIPDDQRPQAPISMDFVESNHVFLDKDNQDEKRPITIKVDKLVQLKITGDYVALGLYHTHPNYCMKPITSINAKKTKAKIPMPENGTPFEVHGKNSVFYKSLRICGEDLQVPINAAIFKVDDDGMTNLTFRVSSTDPANDGLFKDAKEWKLLAIPLNFDKYNEILQSQESFVVTSRDLEFHAELRLQVKEEIRKNAKLTKGHRNNEILLPTTRKMSSKRKAMEDLYMAKQYKKMKILSDSQLQLELESM